MGEFPATCSGCLRPRKIAINPQLFSPGRFAGDDYGEEPVGTTKGEQILGFAEG